MQGKEPKRRTTQIGIGGSGLRPRADEVASKADTKDEIVLTHGVLCPPPSSPSQPSGSAEHGTVEFSDQATTQLRESVRERIASATNEIERLTRDEAERRERLGRSGEAATPVKAPSTRPASDPSRARQRVIDREEADGRATRADLFEAPRPEPARSRMDSVREREPAPSSKDRGLRSERETLRGQATWDIDDPPPVSARPVSRPAAAPASRPPATSRSAPPASPRSVPANARSSPPASASGPPHHDSEGKGGRAALRVDEVGTHAVRLAARASLDAKPKVLVHRRALASAPIDHREAFLVSLMDGTMTVGGLVDVAGMRESEVMTALQRLARLGIIALG